MLKPFYQFVLVCYLVVYFFIMLTALMYLCHIVKVNLIHLLGGCRYDQLLELVTGCLQILGLSAPGVYFHALILSFNV